MVHAVGTNVIKTPRGAQCGPVSLVVPVRNEEASLPVLIDALRRQTYPPAEILIVNGGSTDATAQVVRVAAQYDQRFQLLDTEAGTPGRNRNLGAASAKHEWIAFTDAGTRPEPAWLEELVRAAEMDPSVEVVYGNYEPVADNFFEQCAALAYPPPKVERPAGRMRGPSTASMMLRRDVWKLVGGFPDLRASEDLAFIAKVDAAGYGTAWAPTATVWWHLEPSLARTFRKFVLYSKHNVWAGRQWDWHYGVARQYGIAFLFAILGLWHSRWWLLYLPAWLSARVLRSIWRRLEGRGLWWGVNPARLIGVATLLLTIDLATLVGWVQAKTSHKS